MAKPGKLRIIGGQWRGRSVDICTREGLRPTPDRVRETLFNWLAPVITGAHCLDGFAGTGALGLEALSRGAGDVVFIEKDASLAKQIQQQLQRLGGNGQVNCSPFARAVSAAAPFDVVFLDPPFNADLLAPAAAAVRQHLRPGNRVYMEYGHGDAPQLSAGWEILRAKQAGQVGYCLATYASASEDTTHEQ